MVRNVLQVGPKRGGRRRTPDGKAAQRHAFIGNEALGRLLVQMVTDPQAQFVADAAETVRKIAAVDRRDQDLLVGLIIRVRPQHSVEFGVRAVIEREGAVFVAVGVFEVEAAFSGREPGPVSVAVLCGGGHGSDGRGWVIRQLAVDATGRVPPGSSRSETALGPPRASLRQKSRSASSSALSPSSETGDGVGELRFGMVELSSHGPVSPRAVQLPAIRPPRPEPPSTPLRVRRRGVSRKRRAPSPVRGTRRASELKSTGGSS